MIYNFYIKGFLKANKKIYVQLMLEIGLKKKKIFQENNI